MTAVNVTIAGGRAWLSSDTQVSAGVPGAMREGGVTADAAEAHRSAAGSARPGPPAPVVGHAPKVLAVPRLRLAGAGSGHARLLYSWHVALENIGAAVTGLDEVADEAPDALAALAAMFPVGERNLTIVLVGWSARAARCVGWAFASAEGFRPVGIPAGHAFCPAPAWGGPDHPELRRLSIAAAEGREVEAFHLALGRNQARACRAGTYGGGLGIGGELLLAEVDEAGAGCRTVGEL